MIYLVIPIFLFLVLAAGAFLAFKAGAAHSNQDLSEARKGCLSTLINGLLRPVPIIFAFYQFGLPVALIALDQLLGMTLRRPRLSSIDPQEMPFSHEERKLVRWSILAASLLCLLISEYARLNLSLTEWFWYYGYFRIELIVLFIVSLIPAMIKMNKRSEDE